MSSRKGTDRKSGLRELRHRPVARDGASSVERSEKKRGGAQFGDRYLREKETIEVFERLVSLPVGVEREALFQQLVSLGAHSRLVSAILRVSELKLPDLEVLVGRDLPDSRHQDP